MNNQKIALAIVDDHQIVIDGLKSLLKDHPYFFVAIECTKPAELAEMMQHTKTDILITDVMMPGMNGAELAGIIKAKYPLVKIMALSMSGEGDLVNKMIEQSDIAGYVLKNIGKKELISALEKIAAGGIYFSEEVLDEMLKVAETRKINEEVHLTLREIEIIRLIEKEMNNKQIAAELFISERTVETHRKNIFRKTETTSLIGLVKYAYQHQLIKK